MSCVDAAAEPKLIDPGFAWAAATRSASVLKPLEGGTTSTVGRFASGATPARSRAVSYDRPGYRKGATVCAEEVASSVYPSGSAFATNAAAMVVLAPGRFSTITG